VAEAAEAAVGVAEAAVEAVAEAVLPLQVCKP